MSKAAEMAKVSAKGSFHLLWGLVASTVISAVGTVFVGRLLSPSEFGLYSIAFAAPNLISLFRDWGVTTAVTKYTAQYKSENKIANVKSIFVAGLVFETVLGLSLTIVSFFLSGFLATSVFNRPLIVPLIQIAASTILTGAFFGTAQAAFTGIERMELNSITLLIQSIFKSILVPAFVILGMEALGAVTGYAITMVLSSAVSLMLLRVIYRELQMPAGFRLEIVKNMGIMLKYGLPVSISNILSGFRSQFYLFVLAIFATNLTVGNVSVSNTFGVIITFFSAPILTVMFPAFSKLDPEKDGETLKNVYRFSVKYAALFVIPVAFLLAALSYPAVFTLFGNKYATAPFFLTLMSVTTLLPAFGNLSNSNLINGIGKTRFNLELSLIAALIGLPLGFVLIRQFGAIGYIIVSVVDGLPSVIICLYWLKKNYGVTVDLSSSAKIILSSGTAAAVTYFAISIMPFSSWLRLIVGMVIFIFAVLSAILSTRAINRTDVNNLRGMLAELGALRRFFNFLLNILEKLMTVFQP